MPPKPAIQFRRYTRGPRKGLPMPPMRPWRGNYVSPEGYLRAVRRWEVRFAEWQKAFNSEALAQLEPQVTGKGKEGGYG